MIYKGLLRSTCLVLCGKIRPCGATYITFTSRLDCEHARSRSIDQLTPSADPIWTAPSLLMSFSMAGSGMCQKGARIESPQPGTPFELFAAKSGRAPES